MDITRNPPLNAALADALIGLWTAVTADGGAVGFLAGVPDGVVEAAAHAALNRVAAGTDDLVIASVHGRLVGFGFLEARGHALAAHTGLVKRLQSAPDHRGSGVGGRVLDEIEAAARDRGYSLLALTVRGGTGTEAFYVAHGFRVDGRLPARLRTADGSLVEEIHMSKPLAPEAAAASARLLVHRLDPELPLPSYAHPGDAGLDLCAASAVKLEPGARAAVPTGLAVAIPLGCVGLVHPRSGLAARHGIGIVNAPGTIDSGYRGEVKVLLINLGAEMVAIDRGERIAQLVIQRIEHVEVVEADTLDDTRRGTGGFGSTGR